jgi:uncharacterized protein with PIN domain
MKKNEKAVATNNGSILRTRNQPLNKKTNSKGESISMSNSTTTLKEIQVDFRFADMRLVCDECAAPLHLYGEHFIDSYTNGRANILRCLCDLHTEELGLEVAK